MNMTILAQGNPHPLHLDYTVCHALIAPYVPPLTHGIGTALNWRVSRGNTATASVECFNQPFLLIAKAILCGFPTQLSHSALTDHLGGGDSYKMILSSRMWYRRPKHRTSLLLSPAPPMVSFIKFMI